MKKLLLLPLLLLISVNAFAAKLLIVNSGEQHIAVTFKICTKGDCRFKTAAGGPGPKVIFEEDIEISPGQVVEMTGLTGSLNGGAFFKFVESCRTELDDDLYQGRLDVFEIDNRAYCHADNAKRKK